MFFDGAQPRDLQFCRPVLEMFFEQAVWALRPVEPALSLSKGPTAKRQPSPVPGFPATQHRTRLRVRLSVKKGA